MICLLLTREGTIGQQEGMEREQAILYSFNTFEDSATRLGGRRRGFALLHYGVYKRRDEPVKKGCLPAFRQRERNYLFVPVTLEREGILKCSRLAPSPT